VFTARYGLSIWHSTILHSAHTVFMCFVFIWEQTATCATYSMNWSVFITEMKSVYSAVRTGALNKAVCASTLEGLISSNYTILYIFFIPTCLWRWNRVFRNVGIQNSDAGELPRRKNIQLLQNGENLKSRISSTCFEQIIVHHQEVISVHTAHTIFIMHLWCV
jgi:hypothetical protein